MKDIMRFKEFRYGTCIFSYMNTDVVQYLSVQV